MHIYKCIYFVSIYIYIYGKSAVGIVENSENVLYIVEIVTPYIFTVYRTRYVFSVYKYIYTIEYIVYVHVHIFIVCNRRVNHLKKNLP